jgi:hypothetical protein
MDHSLRSTICYGRIGTAVAIKQVRIDGIDDVQMDNVEVGSLLATTTRCVCI